MSYDFKDVKINREFRYSLGKEITTGKCYLSFPVRNSYVDYIEYYELSLEQLNIFMKNEEELLDFLDKCKRRKKDELMVFFPIAPIRGYPT